jgi:hypothetical protein
VVADKLGVMNDAVPVDRAVPPEGVAYQSIVSPVAALAEMVTVPAPHLEVPIPVGGLGTAFTKSVIEHELWHPLALVMVTL